MFCTCHLKKKKKNVVPQQSHLSGNVYTTMQEKVGKRKYDNKLRLKLCQAQVKLNLVKFSMFKFKLSEVK